MTTHYNIEIILTKTHFKVTYRNNKVRSIVHLKGKLTPEMLIVIGRIIPLMTGSIEVYKQKYSDRVNYTQIISKKTDFTEFKDVWFTFYEKLTQRTPKFSGAEGNALKRIIKYLKERNELDEQKALQSFVLLLDNWKYLDTFHQKNTSLTYIDSKLNVIIQNLGDNLKKTTSGSHISTMQRANNIADNLFNK